jgi:hypothetical protein
MKTAMEKLKEIVEETSKETNSIFPTSVLMHINLWGLEYEKLQNQKEYAKGYNDGFTDRPKESQ